MESDDEAEVCLLSGIFMLSLIGNKYNTNNIGTLEYTEMTDWQFLKNTSYRNLNKLKRFFKKCLRTKV